LWTPFQRDVNELAHVKLQDLLGDEARIDEMLSARGIDVDSLDSIAKQNKIADLKYTTRGRKAIAGLTVASTVGLVMNDRITGDGLYDKEAQRNRVKQTNWKKRSVKGLDGRYYSYEWLGPLADWIAFTVNVVDNFDMLGEAMTEKFLEKSTFVLGAALTDRTALSTLRPLVEMAAGNGFEANRWSAGFVNSLAPLSGQRREWSRIFSEGMREVDNDFISYLENANSFMGELDPSNRNPYVYSPVSGKKANGYGFLQRLYNAYSPLKIHDGQTDEERFLQEIEYDVSTSFKTKDGVKLTRDERSELFRIMGEDQIFATSIREIMQDAGDWESIAKLRKLRRLPNLTTSDEVPLKQWHDIHVRLGEAQRAAEAFAFSRMDADMFAAIELRQEEKILREKAAVLGESLDPTLSIRN
jgi:hypothetical protein